MINVDRKRVARPAELDNRDAAGLTEKDRAISYYDPYDDAKEAFKFQVYRHPKVKNALIELFRGKCAYCESTFLHVYSGDVEHFRPKGEIEGVTPNSKPGYYWLAADWDNLLLSCRNCNQKLTHAIFGQTDKVTMGKMNQFPLAPLGIYVRRHDHLNGIKDEEIYRLLLDPCLDDPEKHLEYGPQGIIRPKKDANGQPSQMGKTSIDVYVLQRAQLVMARERALIDIEAQLQRVMEATKNFNRFMNDPDTALRFYFDNILKRELSYLKQFLAPEQQYLGMARQVINGFMQLNFGFTI